jgi:WD40 repeat protein
MQINEETKSETLLASDLIGNTPLAIKQQGSQIDMIKQNLECVKQIFDQNLFDFYKKRLISSKLFENEQSLEEEINEFSSRLSLQNNENLQNTVFKGIFDEVFSKIDSEINIQLQTSIPKPDPVFTDAIHLTNYEYKSSKGIVGFAMAHAQPLNLLFLGTNEGTVQWFDDASFESLGILPNCHAGTIISLTYLLNRNLLVSTSYDKTLKIWNYTPNQLELTATLSDHKDSVNGIFLVENKNEMWSFGRDSDIRVWSLETFELLGKI